MAANRTCARTPNQAHTEGGDRTGRARQIVVWRGFCALDRYILHENRDHPSYGDEQPRGFSSPDVLAEWLRPMLLGREEDSAD